jgi:hypothetical protein
MILFILLGLLPQMSHAEDPWVLGMEELYRVDLLPQLKRSIHVGSVSSYDRTGGNDDGFSGKHSFVAREAGSLVIADLEGPGILYRIWTPTPTDDLVEFFFDGESKPRIRVRFRDLFTGKEAPFISPLVGSGAGGFYSYVPLSFRKSCKVVVRAERLQFYQINYARYPDDAPIRTYMASRSTEDRLHQTKAAAFFASSGSDASALGIPGGIVPATHRANVSLQPGATATLFETQEPGRIVGIRLAPATALAGKRRDLLLRIRWDDEAEPAVLCPLGDFFGYAWGQPATRSLLVGTNDDVNYCYFPMPFDEKAKIELVSEASDGPPVDIRCEVVHASVRRRGDEGKFYAVWRRENPTTLGVPFTFLDMEGAGHVVGCILQSQGMVSGNTYFFEGDDQTTIDGQTTIHGTGSEDFFNGGWYDVAGRWEKRLSFPLSGCLGYQKHLGRTGGYRLMLGDAYAFRQSIRHTIEHAPTENNLETDYCGLTYLYLREPPTATEPLPSAEQRKVVDFDRIVFTPSWAVPIHAFTFRGATITKMDEQIDGQTTGFLRFTAEGPDWVGPPFISLVCEIPAAGSYKVSIEAVKGPGQAQVQLFQDREAAGPAVDLYAAERTRSELLDLGTLSLDEGPINLMFKLVGKDERSRGLGLDLITIQCERAE